MSKMKTRLFSLTILIFLIGNVSAQTSPFQEAGSRLVATLFSSLIFVGVGIVIFTTLAGLAWYFIIYRRKFNIEVKITSERSGDRNRILFDRAAILKDRKTKSKFFRLWKTRADLPAPKFNVLQSTDKGDYLEIYRTAEDTFYFLTPAIVDKTKVVKSDGNEYSLATQINKMVDPDMQYWGAKRLQDNKGMFDTESLAMKLLPYIPLLMGGAILIFILYILMDSLPTILGELTRLTSELHTLQGGSTTVVGS